MRVPVKGGSTIINDYVNNKSVGNVPFYNNPNVVSVDLRNVPFVNNSMLWSFHNCSNLISISNISNSVTNMVLTFNNCVKFDYNVQIPNSVTNMYGSFSNCTSLNKQIQIPNSVIYMDATFSNCTSLNSSVRIGSSVRTMEESFKSCTNLNKKIQIPGSVRVMSDTFFNCTSFNQPVQIPGSVTSLSGAFRGCINLDKPIQMGNAVEQMRDTFRNCKKFNQNITLGPLVGNIPNTFYDCSSFNKTITIHSPVVYYAQNFVEGTPECNVGIPFTYFNGANTDTLEAFQSAGYVNSDGTTHSQRNAIIYDISTTPSFASDWEGFATSDGFVGLIRYIGTNTSFVGPTIEGGQGKAGYLGTAFGSRRWSFDSIDCANIPFISSDLSNVFDGCVNAQYINNLNLSNASSMFQTFNNCKSLVSIGEPLRTFIIPGSVVNLQSTFAWCFNFNQPLRIGSLANDMRYTFYDCTNFNQATQIPSLVTNMQGTFGNCTSLQANITVLSSEVTGADVCFGGTTLPKNVYIPYTYTNGVNTTTFNSFVTAGYLYANGVSNSQHGVTVYDLNAQ